MVSCRSPNFPKIVTTTCSSKLAFWSLKSVDFEASTVKILRGPSIFENVNPLDCFSTFSGAGAGAALRSMILCQPRFRYTPAVRQASSSATAADQRAYRAASLLRIGSVKQNSQKLYRRWREERRSAGKLTRLFRQRLSSCPAKFQCLPRPRCLCSYFSPDTWLRRRGARDPLWCANRWDTRPHLSSGSNGCSILRDRASGFRG